MSMPLRRGTLTVAFSAAAALLLALAACTQSGGQNTPPTVPVAATIPVAADTRTPPPTVVMVPTSTSLPTAAAKPTPTLAATSTPVATETPDPTATPPPPTPQPTATPIPPPTATPRPTATPTTPQPDTTRLDLGAGVFLSVSPEAAIAGRDVSFSLSGLPPWDRVTITFIDPQGVPASWITDEDVRVLEQDGSEATTIVMYPAASGVLDWKRYGAQDETGAWSMDIDVAGGSVSITYTMHSLKLSDVETVSLGTLLTRHPAPGFDIYYSDLVPAALVVDLQEHLSDTALLLERRTQTEMGQIPDVYLAGNRELMTMVSSVTGIDLGLKDGYYINFGQRPGIFMRTDLTGTEVRRLLTHEYIHHIFDGLANERTLPAWLTEGLSKYYEFDTALSGPRPDASRLRQFAATDLARTAAQAGALFSLTALESQSDWNSRTDRAELALQYAEAYMVVRFLNETYGPLSGKDMVVEMGRGSSLSTTIKTVTGLDLGVFESQFNRWLVKWEDRERGPIADYLTALEVILAAESANSEQRAENLNTSMTAGESVSSRAALVRSTEELIDSLHSLSPPDRAQSLHDEAEEHFGRVLVWLTLELQAAEAQDNTPLIAANAMIPELRARDFTLKRNLSNLQFIFNIDQ